jgi:hypothetical protein
MIGWQKKGWAARVMPESPAGTPKTAHHSQREEQTTQ